MSEHGAGPLSAAPGWCGRNQASGDSAGPGRTLRAVMTWKLRKQRDSTAKTAREQARIEQAQ